MEYKHQNKTLKLIKNLGEIKEVAKKMNLSYHTVYGWILRDSIPEKKAVIIVKKFGKKHNLSLNNIRPGISNKGGI